MFNIIIVGFNCNSKTNAIGKILDEMAFYPAEIVKETTITARKFFGTSAITIATNTLAAMG
jgi:hypothetical protein